MIYLIGVDHSVQHDGSPIPWRPGLAAQREAFHGYLRAAAKTYGIGVVAEELNEDALNVAGASASTAQRVAAELGLEHVFCEPALAVRVCLGITTDLRHHAVRERFWLDCLSGYRSENLLFICGVDHISGFHGLLRRKGWDAAVLSRYYAEAFFCRN